jgi:hypothetical protein
MKRIAGISLCCALLVASLAAPAAFAAPAIKVRLAFGQTKKESPISRLHLVGSFCAVESFGLQSQQMLTASQSVTSTIPTRHCGNSRSWGSPSSRGCNLMTAMTQLKGMVYNAENGKVYDVYLDPNGATMGVEGCFAMFLCGSQTWTRVR